MSACWKRDTSEPPGCGRLERNLRGGEQVAMRSIGFADFLIGIGVLLVIEGLLFAAAPNWMRQAMRSALVTPDNIMRAAGIGSAVIGLILIWLIRR